LNTFLFTAPSKIISKEIPNHLLIKFLDHKEDEISGNNGYFAQEILFAKESYYALVYRTACPAGGICEWNTLVTFNKEGREISSMDYSPY